MSRKKCCITAIVIFLSFSQLKSQTVNDIPLKDIDINYVQIVGTSKSVRNKVTIKIDFGQENEFFSADKETRIKDVNNKKVVFNSMIDALNFMTKNGYEFVQAYAFSTGSDSENLYYYLLKKSKKAVNLISSQPEPELVTPPRLGRAKQSFFLVK